MDSPANLTLDHFMVFTWKFDIKPEWDEIRPSNYSFIQLITNPADRLIDSRILYLSDPTNHIHVMQSQVEVTEFSMD